MLKTDQFRKKLKVELDGVPYMMVDVDFVRPGKGQGFVRTKLKNMISGAMIERTFKSNESVKPAAVRDEEMQFLYENGGDYSFMDNRTYDQITMTADQLGTTVNYIYEGLTGTISFFNDIPIGCEIANFVELEIIECEPGMKGNTATNAMKPAKVTSGYRVNVPLFVNQGEWIRIDTRTGDYSERCKRPEGR